MNPKEQERIDREAAWAAAHPNEAVRKRLIEQKKCPHFAHAIERSCMCVKGKQVMWLTQPSFAVCDRCWQRAMERDHQVIVTPESMDKADWNKLTEEVSEKP